MILLLKIKSGLNPCKIAIFQDFKPLSFPCLTFVSEMLIVFSSFALLTVAVQLQPMAGDGKTLRLLLHMNMCKRTALQRNPPVALQTNRIMGMSVPRQRINHRPVFQTYIFLHQLLFFKCCQNSVDRR